MRIIHLIPYDGIGGVETAAHSLEDGRYSDIHFSKLYIVDKACNSAANPYRSENDPRAWFRALRILLALKPDLVIASLWRSCIPLIALKVLRPRTRVVTFLHLPIDVHWLDWTLNRLAMILSVEIWADSEATLHSRVASFMQPRTRVISFLVYRLEPVVSKPAEPVFVFWGRLHAQKGLLRALHIFAFVRHEEPMALFHIIGPDGGERSRLEREVVRLGLQESVHFHGAMDQMNIFRFAASCSLYLQTSELEGMGMSVVEAMQLGLVPVVTPVGEIAHYCKDGHNAVLVHDDKKVATDLLRLLSDYRRYQRLRNNAVSIWLDKPLYKDDVIQACRLALKRTTKNFV